MQVGTALSILPKDPADVPLAHAGHLSHMALAKAPESRRHDLLVPLRPLRRGHEPSVLPPSHATHIVPITRRWSERPGRRAWSGQLEVSVHPGEGAPQAARQPVMGPR